MQCISPINIRDPADPKHRISVPCGKCYACLSNKRTSWTYRLMQEQKHSITSKFITLTYDDVNVPLSPSGEMVLSKEDVQLWLKRFRKRISPYKIRYFYVGEYGGKFRRPHYHLLLFDYPLDSRDLFSDIGVTWTKGNFYVGSVSQASIHYVAKYVIARMDKDKYSVPPFMRCSNKPGIGYQWLTDEMTRFARREYGCVVPMPAGYRCAMPRYYRDKIYTNDAEKDIVRRKNLSMSREIMKQAYESDKAYMDAFAASGMDVPAYSTSVVKDQIRKGKKVLKDLNNELD